MPFFLKLYKYYHTVHNNSSINCTINLSRKFNSINLNKYDF